MELIEKQTSPLNPFARWFVFIWLTALLAAAGFRAVKPSLTAHFPSFGSVKKAILAPNAN